MATQDNPKEGIKPLLPTQPDDAECQATAPDQQCFRAGKIFIIHKKIVILSIRDVSVLVKSFITHKIDRLVQERRNPSALAMELRLSCIITRRNDRYSIDRFMVLQC